MDRPLDYTAAFSPQNSNILNSAKKCFRVGVNSEDICTTLFRPFWVALCEPGLCRNVVISTRIGIVMTVALF